MSRRSHTNPYAISTYHRRGATASEYILILALIVLPIGLMLPMFLHMISVYGTRLAWMLGLPYP